MNLMQVVNGTNGTSDHKNDSDTEEDEEETYVEGVPPASRPVSVCVNRSGAAAAVASVLERKSKAAARERSAIFDIIHPSSAASSPQLQEDSYVPPLDAMDDSSTHPFKSWSALLPKAFNFQLSRLQQGFYYEQVTLVSKQGEEKELCIGSTVRVIGRSEDLRVWALRTPLKSIQSSVWMKVAPLHVKSFEEFERFHFTDLFAVVESRCSDEVHTEMLSYYDYLRGIDLERRKANNLTKKGRTTKRSSFTADKPMLEANPQTPPTPSTTVKTPSPQKSTHMHLRSASHPLIKKQKRDEEIGSDEDVRSSHKVNGCSEVASVPEVHVEDYRDILTALRQMQEGITDRMAAIERRLSNIESTLESGHGF